MIILAGMFVYGDRIATSPSMVYSENKILEIPKDTFCSEEVERYRKELDKAQEQIESLNTRLRQGGKMNKPLTSLSSN